MAQVNNKENPIASNEAFQIVCPYCFNMASGGKGVPFSHRDVEFRAETSFSNNREIEQIVGFKEIDIDLADSQAERDAKRRQYDTYKRFLLKTDEKYQAFWNDFEGRTTEQTERSGHGATTPWELPIIGLGNGATSLGADVDGFVTNAVDEFGKITHRRVCPHCHNPLPLGYGKNPVKYISIIGITGAGKTVYISQLLKGMSDYAAKVGLNAYFTSDHETNFIETNKVKKDVPLPDSTSPGRLSQPMFYDIVRTENREQCTDTIVLYDIAGENCRNANDMVRFSRFVEHSDGLILLVDPKQLGFLDEIDEDEVDAPSLALNTLHSVLESERGKKSDIPIAVCVSKSDQCIDILPAISQEQVQNADLDETGLPKKEFDGKTFNELSKNIKELMMHNARSVCQNLESEYYNYNFFSVSAIGCSCGATEKGFFAPLSRPDPKRIEEPILWLFKHFGFIKSNAKVFRPFKIKHSNRYIYKKPLIGKACLYQEVDEYSFYEEDKVREKELVLFKGSWVDKKDFDNIPIKMKGE